MSLLTLLWASLQCEKVAFLGHAHLRFDIIFTEPCAIVIVIQCICIFKRDILKLPMALALMVTVEPSS